MSGKRQPGQAKLKLITLVHLLKKTVTELAVFFYTQLDNLAKIIETVD